MAAFPRWKVGMSKKLPASLTSCHTRFLKSPTIIAITNEVSG